MKITKSLRYTLFLSIIAVFYCCEQNDESLTDKDAPAEVSDFMGISGHDSIKLTWTEPLNSDFEQVELVYFTETEHTKFIEKGTHSYSALNLNSNTEYTFTIKTLDKNGNKSEGVTISVSTKPNVIMPLAVGYEWTYIDSTNYPLMFQDLAKFGITGKSTITYKGEAIDFFLWTWYDYETKSYSDFSWLCKNDEEGLSFYGILNSFDTLLFDNKKQYFKYPAEVNYSWISYSHLIAVKTDHTIEIIDTDTIQNQILFTSQVYEAPFATFPCFVNSLKFNLLDEETNALSYFTPDIGYVYYEQKSDTLILARKISSYNLTEKELLVNNGSKTLYAKDRYITPFGIVRK